ncbi:uncharacterized protein LOC134221738 [Armigeres subalbatus]|uniref:uncharacterized protein LOC134221738 n=1 Tax=Armigeres subalbatus TaxID=124917 RepID=UPI002ED030BA
MQSLFSRAKRQTSSGLTGDLNTFRTTDRAYLNFIQSLISALTESGEVYGNIRVTKRKDGITKVTLKDSATNTQVGFIYRNRDLYIVGLVVGNTFYIDREVYDGLSKKIPNSWKTVINASLTVALSNPFSYNQILPSGESTSLQIGKLGDSLRQLTQIGDTSKRSQIMTQHLGPFVVAFSEAIRFPVVARSVQNAIRKNTGTVSLSTNLVQPLSLGHPSERTPKHVFTMYSLLLNWSKLSDRVPAFYGNPPKQMPPLVEGRYTVNLEKNQLNTLLGVANSYRFQKFTPAPVNNRGKRDLQSLFDSSTRPNPAQLEQHINYVDFEGNVQGANPPPPMAMVSIMHNVDVVGALHLFTVGLMYLYRRKMNVPLEVNSYQDPREALAVAVDMSDRIQCFLQSTVNDIEVGFEDQAELQRQIAQALTRGDDLETVLTKFLERHYSDVEDLDALREQLSRALAAESGLVQGVTFNGKECFV